MAQLFEDEKKYPDNRARENFIFLGYPYTPALPKDDYASVINELQGEYPVRLWYFTDELTTDEMMRKIWRAILRADLAIFDVSEGNANVAFELGLAAASNKSCMTVHKRGTTNPLGAADTAYAEHVEYDSRASLKTKLGVLIERKSTAGKRIREAANQVFDSNAPQYGVDDLALTIRKLLNVVYREKRLTKPRAEEILDGRRKLADTTMNQLRELSVLQVEGGRRHAKWVFSDGWVYHDHEVAGV